MRDQHAAAIEMHQDVFGAARKALDAMALDPMRQILWDRTAQIGPGQIEPRQALSRQGKREAAHHGLNFGKFGHFSSGVALVGRGLAIASAIRYLAEMRRQDTSDTQDRDTDFGFRRVSEKEKTRLVHGVFDRVAARYDLMNDLMSGGIHRLWKMHLIERLDPRPGQTLLDLAGGTGDVARRALDRAGNGGIAIVCDINESMIRRGRDRSIDRGILDDIIWLAGNAESLPLADGSVDACTISFGLRNVTRIDLALREIRRVLRPGGRFLSLEFSRVEGALMRRAYDLYSFALLPRLGQVVTRDRDAYQYLVESIRRFPPQQELAAMMEEAGFEQVRWRNLSGGIAAIHTGWRL
jgi:demethylmenaquinone methyltransferase/2-methoxy-6-polyprenyl-1,4-benzoquinol methylase